MGSIPGRSTALSRRAVLALGIGGAVAALTTAGCTENPPANGPTLTPSASGPSASPSPAATPTLSGAAAAAATEAGLAALARAIRADRGKTLSTRQRSLLAFLVGAHTAYASALLPGPSTVPPPKLGSTATTALLRRLARNQSTAAASYRRSALAAQGLDALLWGSLSVAAGRFAAATTDSTPPLVSSSVAARGAAGVLADVAAVQNVVAQLHAVVYGYQLAIGRLPVLSKQHARAVPELLAVRVLRDRLSRWLTDRKAEVPAAEPAYVPTVRPRDAATSAALIRHLHVALQPHLGLWLAAATSTGDRRLALDTLARTARLAEAWGGPLQAWPGYE